MVDFDNLSTSKTCYNLAELQEIVKTLSPELITKLSKNEIDCSETESEDETASSENIPGNDSKKLKLQVESENIQSNDSKDLKLIKTLKILQNAGIDFNTKDMNWRTILHVAFGKRIIEVIKILIECGCNINESDYHGNNIAHHLVELCSKSKKEISMIEWLLSNGLDVDCKNSNKDTPLHLAAKRNLLQVLLILIKYSKDINAVDNNNRTVFHLLIMYNIKSRNNIGQAEPTIGEPDYLIEICKQLLDKGCSVDVTEIFGNTPLHLALKHENIPIARLMLEKFTNVNAQNEFGDTALSAFIRICSRKEVEKEKDIVDLISSLINKGTNIHRSFREHSTPIHLAAICKHAEIFKMLVDHGAKLKNVKNDTTLLHCVCNSARDPLKDEDYKKIIDLLISKGVDVNIRDSDEWTPLHTASSTSATVAVIQRLIYHGADIHCRSKNEYTALHFAVKNRATHLFRVLVESKVDINAKDSEGNTPIHLAAKHSSPAISESLLELGADVNEKNKNGKSALYHAAKNEHIAVMKILLKYGADINDIKLLRRIEKITRNQKVLACVMEHWCKLNVAKLPVGEYYREYYKDIPLEFANKCTKEVEILKEHSIDNRTTFYDFLYMKPNSRCAYTNDEKMCKLVGSPDLANQFPNYCTLIFGFYREAVKRKALLKLASRNWYEITKIHMPDVCLYAIFDNLDNEDLKMLTLKVASTSNFVNPSTSTSNFVNPSTSTSDIVQPNTSKCKYENCESCSDVEKTGEKVMKVCPFSNWREIKKLKC